MLQKSPGIGVLALALALSTFHGAVDAQTPTVTLTITTDGVVSGAVGVQGPNGNVCNPNPGGGPGGGTCVFTYPVGSVLRMAANSPGTPGAFHDGTGDTAGCPVTSTCNFTINSNSSIIATFGGYGPYPSLTINLLGDGKGNVGTDNNQCQNFELGFSACTTYYVAGSEVKLQGRSMPGNIFQAFSNGTADAVNCGAPSLPTDPCMFTLTSNSTLDATFSALSSVAITPSSQSTLVNLNAFFNARATFTNGMTRFSFNGASPWQSHVQMDVARFSLAAAAVNDRLYAIGGVDGACPTPGPGCPFSPLNTVEVFNPLVTAFAEFDQAWTPREGMSIPRGGLVAAAVNGTIYAIGGYTNGGAAVASAEGFDPAANHWTPRAPMSSARSNMAAAVIGDTIYVVGGTDGTGADALIPRKVEAYNTSTNSWSTRTPMATARTSPTAAAVNGTLYVIGGDGVGSVEAYNPNTDTWTSRASMPGGGGSFRTVALNGLIYAVGGSPVTTKVYNPALNSWLTLPTPPQAPPSGEFALAVMDGRMFAAGGNLADTTAVRSLLANRPPEATWWSNNSAVGRINSSNNGSVAALSVGTATISARLVGVDSGAQSATLTVNSSSQTFPIFLGIPSDNFGGAFATVGTANWGCGTFGQTSIGPWTVQIDYGQGGGFESTPYIANPPVDGMCVQSGQFPKGLFNFNHAYNAAGDYLVTVKVTNTGTSQTQTGSFHVHVQPPAPVECVALSTNFTAIGSLPFDSVHLEAFDRTTGDPVGAGDLPFGPFDLGEIEEGSFHVELSVPAGYMITPANIDFDAVCDQPIVLSATVQAIPPTISLQLSPTVLWAPNNKMATVNATIAASSPSGHPTTVTLVSITSNEGGSGDIAGAAIGTDDRQFEVRASRDGGGSGRTYTITYQVTDTVTGGTATASATVFVPHDQRQ